jgi:opacity protein-like surface antigen
MKMKSHYPMLGVSAALVAASAVAAYADNAGGGSFSDPGLYMKADAGLNYIQDATISGQSGKAKFDPGFRIGIAGGYNLNSWSAIELETGFLRNGIKDSGNAWFGAVPVLANAVFRYENDSKFVPYAGIGVGGAYTMVEGSGDSHTDFVFAWQAMVGVRYELSKSAAFDLGYKMFSTADQTYNGTKVSDFYSHMIGLGFIWKF